MTLTLPKKIPYHFKREHVPSGRVWFAEFNGTHSMCFKDESWARTNALTLVGEINDVIGRWNRQQPIVWKYTALLGHCPEPSNAARAPDGAWIT